MKPKWSDAARVEFIILLRFSRRMVNRISFKVDVDDDHRISQLARPDQARHSEFIELIYRKWIIYKLFNYSAFASELSWVIQHIIMMYLTFIHTIHRILQEIEQTHLESPASCMCVSACVYVRFGVRVDVERRNCIESRRISRRCWRFSVSKCECEYVLILNDLLGQVVYSKK